MPEAYWPWHLSAEKTSGAPRSFVLRVNLRSKDWFRKHFAEISFPDCEQGSPTPLRLLLRNAFSTRV